MEEILQLLAMLFERDFEDEWMNLHPSLFCKICLQTLLSVTDNELIVILQWVYCVFIMSYKHSAWWIWEVIIKYLSNVLSLFVIRHKEGLLLGFSIDIYILREVSWAILFASTNQCCFAKTRFAHALSFLKFDSPYLTNILKSWKRMMIWNESFLLYQ